MAHPIGANPSGAGSATANPLPNGGNSDSRHSDGRHSDHGHLEHGHSDDQHSHGHAGDATTANNVHQMAATKLAAVSQRYTSNRKNVVDALLGLPGPATIAELLAAGSGLAQSSTYRNLVVLEDVGVVHRIITSDDHARFELTEEVTGQHHHHLICERCGLIIDVTLEASVEAALEDALSRGAAAHHFRGIHHRVDLVGICRSCETQSP